MSEPTESGTDENGGDTSHTEIRRPTAEESSDLDERRSTGRTQRILDDADQRDEAATARDAVAEERAQVADQVAFLDPASKYAGHGERRAAAQDRRDSKSDRESSAEDRAQLTDNDS